MDPPLPWGAVMEKSGWGVTEDWRGEESEGGLVFGGGIVASAEAIAGDWYGDSMDSHY